MSERKAKVYAALLNRRDSTSADLQKSSGIPQTKVYEIVRQLMREGYCRERKVGRRRIFEAVDPQTALNQSIRRIEARLEAARGLKEELSELYRNLGKGSEPIEYIEMFHGAESIHNHYIQFLRSARREVLGFGCPPYSCDNQDKIDEQGNEIKAFIDRGGVSRWVYQVDNGTPQWLREGFKRLEKMGVQIRVIDILPMKMMIFDSKEVFFAREDSSSIPGQLSMTIIKQSGVAEAYRALFNFFWNQAQEIQ